MIRLAEIEQQQWQGFCSAYSLQHQGWMVSTYIYDPEINHLEGGNITPRLRVMVTDVPLQGIVLENHGAQTDLLVNLGPGGALFTHRIQNPSHIASAVTDAGLHEGLLIHRENGGVFRIRFREPAMPEALNGWLPADRQWRSEILGKR